MWSDLLFDMLCLISEALTVHDFIRFTSVCRSWRLVYSTMKHSRRNDTPWLLYSGGEHELNTANVYKVSDKKKMKIGNQPGRSLHNRIFLGSAHGWVITADEKSELALVNPVTTQQIDLPAVTTFGHFLPAEHDANGEITHYIYTNHDGFDLTYSVEELREDFYVQATLMHSPGVGDDYTVVIILATRNRIAFTRCGDKKWTIHPNENLRTEISCDNEGKVYTVITGSGIVESWDFTKKDEMPEHSIYVPQNPKLAKVSCESFFYLVQTPWGDTLHVRRRKKGSYKTTWTRRIWIYKVDFERNRMVRIRSIGDYAIFIGGNQPLCISCKNNPNLRPNSVYFTEEDFEKIHSMKRIRRDMGIYCLDDNSIELIMPHNSLLNWPPPIWFQPSLI